MCIRDRISTSTWRYRKLIQGHWHESKRDTRRNCGHGENDKNYSEREENLQVLQEAKLKDKLLCYTEEINITGTSLLSRLCDPLMYDCMEEFYNALDHSRCSFQTLLTIFYQLTGQLCLYNAMRWGINTNFEAAGLITPGDISSAYQSACSGK